MISSNLDKVAENIQSKSLDGDVATNESELKKQRNEEKRKRKEEKKEGPKDESQENILIKEEQAPSETDLVSKEDSKKRKKEMKLMKKAEMKKAKLNEEQLKEKEENAENVEMEVDDKSMEVIDEPSSSSKKPDKNNTPDQEVEHGEEQNNQEIGDSIEMTKEASIDDNDENLSGCESDASRTTTVDGYNFVESRTSSRIGSRSPSSSSSSEEEEETELNTQKSKNPKSPEEISKKLEMPSSSKEEEEENGSSEEEEEKESQSLLEPNDLNVNCAKELKNKRSEELYNTIQLYNTILTSPDHSPSLNIDKKEKASPEDEKEKVASSSTLKDDEKEKVAISSPLKQIMLKQDKKGNVTSASSVESSKTDIKKERPSLSNNFLLPKSWSVSTNGKTGKNLKYKYIAPDGVVFTSFKKAQEHEVTLKSTQGEDSSLDATVLENQAKVSKLVESANSEDDSSGKMKTSKPKESPNKKSSPKSPEKSIKSTSQEHETEVIKENNANSSNKIVANSNNKKSPAQSPKSPEKSIKSPSQDHETEEKKKYEEKKKEKLRLKEAEKNREINGKPTYQDHETEVISPRKENKSPQFSSTVLPTPKETKSAKTNFEKQLFGYDKSELKGAPLDGISPILKPGSKTFEKGSKLDPPNFDGSVLNSLAKPKSKKHKRNKSEPGFQ